MRKRLTKVKILSILLCLFVSLSLVPATGWAATWNGHTHYLCGGSTCNGSGHENESSMTTFAKEIKQEGNTLKIGGEEWKKTDEIYLLAGGSQAVYYLSSDIKPDAPILLNGNATLCLNGHSITANHDGDVIVVNSGVTFTLTDCKGGNSDAAFGKITHASGKDGRGVYVSNRNATFNMYGGSIAGNNMVTDDYVGTNEVGGGVCERRQLQDVRRLYHRQHRRKQRRWRVYGRKDQLQYVRRNHLRQHRHKEFRRRRVCIQKR